MNDALPSADVLRELLRYEPETGLLFWLPRPVESFENAMRAAMWNGRYAGKPAFTADTRGRRSGAILGRNFLAHRAIWCLVTGQWPTHTIDHRDGDPSNNRWANLRAATRSQNVRNRASAKGSSSWFLGVTWAIRRGKWRGQIEANGKRYWLGDFTDELDAARAYDAAAIVHHGSFARLNFPEKTDA